MVLSHIAMDWKAKWIWGGLQDSPRNEWRCFRNTFIVPAEGWDTGTVSITADSRYVLYINGKRVGRGPNRSWPEEQSYDTYTVGHLLKPGLPNTIAVLVQHFGVSTFYYIRGRGGLLAQLDLVKEGESIQRILTDGTWKTSRHWGQDGQAQRMSSQNAFAERIDARLWDEEWMGTSFNDTGWEQARVIGEAGMAPWDRLVPRSIPPLTEEVVYPSRVESLSKVVPIPWSANIELRNQMIPGSEDDANAYPYAGFIATVIRTAGEAKAVIGFTYATPHFQGVIVNGVHYSKSDMTAVRSQKYLETELKAGDNLIMIILAGNDHGRGLFMGIDCEEPFELHSPLEVATATDDDLSPFISIGPFISYEYIDHQFSGEDRAKQQIIDACARFDSATPDNDAAREVISSFIAVGKIGAKEELAAWMQWIRPIPNKFVSKESVAVLSTWKKESRMLPVPASLQQAVAANFMPGPIPVYPREDTEIIVDFGRQVAGYLTFQVEAEEGVILDFHGFEHMRDGWVQDTNYLENTLRYICREGYQEHSSPIKRGFRYVMITVRGARKPVKLYGIQQVQSHYPIAEVGQFHSSDPLLNEIWRISQRTTRLCMEDTFVDCPAYEQTFWVGDARNEALISYYLFGGEEMVKRCLELVPGSRSQTPLYSDQVPSGWSSVIPNWTFLWVNACEEYYERTGDTAFAARLWPHVAFTLDHYLKLLDSRGLLSMDAWNFLDWAPIDSPREGIVTHQNMFLVKALRSAAVLGRLAGDEGRAEFFRDAEDQLAAAIDRHLWSEEKQAYLDCIHSDGRISPIYSMQTQVVSIVCNIPKGERKEKLLQYLTSPPEDFVPIGSPFMSFFYYEALVQAGRYSEMVDDIRKQFGQMLEYGATTCWEMYPKLKGGRIDPENLTRSHCHAWSAAPGYFLGAHVLGVQYAKTGWRKIKVQPQICGLTWARGSVPLPGEGRIDVAWGMDREGLLQLQLWLPDHVEAEVSLPEGIDGTINICRF
ncbi:family 78 glycoside hydrolase catalytic domain [Paenibacillus sp. J2TS4]|uniref:family 78 glycoside hydrolase catalytic domain n=1 Tax=Paenibacillus sp. J2TS4 TaxID=2807194 RepID=UPI001AFF77B7|nr:family 78 glycoside hydrolase catalytic domain [Paenibacillus sp. J2TS4]GIP34125.1 hypothetical protein J2TS4_33350 [Paenibacillus sp. J2TS4]